MFNDALREMEKALEIDPKNSNSINFFQIILKKKTEYDQQKKIILKNEVIEGRINVGPSKKQEIFDLVFDHK